MATWTGDESGTAVNGDGFHYAPPDLKIASHESVGWWGPLDGPQPRSGGDAACNNKAGSVNRWHRSQAVSKQNSTKVSLPELPPAVDDVVGSASGDQLNSCPGASPTLRCLGQGGSDEFCQPGDELPTPSTKQFIESASLRYSLAEVQRQIASCDEAISAIPGELELSGCGERAEAAALCSSICRAVAKRRTLQHEAKERAEEIHDLEEVLLLRNNRHRTTDLPLESNHAAATGLDSSSLLTGGGGGCGAMPSLWGSPCSSGDEATEGVWRECTAALEGELRRKSARVLELHQSVHSLETRLQEQLELHDKQLDMVQKALQGAVEAGSVTCRKREPNCNKTGAAVREMMC